MEVSAKIAVVQQYLEAFDKSDIGIIRDMYADNATVEDPVGTEPYVGIDAVLGFYETALQAGAKLELTGTPRCTGNAVAFPFKAVMGDMHVEIIDVFEFDEAGKVLNMKAYWGPENTVS
ncbi:MAG: nuclear transport factor 2 family protein [Halieaceae bacterium]